MLIDEKRREQHVLAVDAVDGLASKCGSNRSCVQDLLSAVFE